MQDGEVFAWLRDFKQDGLIPEFGASVESMDEAQICLQHEVRGPETPQDSASMLAHELRYGLYGCTQELYDCAVRILASREGTPL